MITEKDLEEAIAECQGKRVPDSNTCIKLAAFYTIKNELFPSKKEFAEVPQYSLAPPVTETAETVVNYDGGSEFAKLINGKRADDVWTVMDELMTDVIRLINPRLYNATLNKIEQ